MIVKDKEKLKMKEKKMGRMAIKERKMRETRRGGQVKQGMKEVEEMKMTKLGDLAQ